MVRPLLYRRIKFRPSVRYFKPQGIPLRELLEVGLTEDEFEAVRLTDLEGLYQEDAAKKMGISRPTLSRILTKARKSIADALINGKAIRIEGGQVELSTPPRGRGFGKGRRWRGGR